MGAAVAKEEALAMIRKHGVRGSATALGEAIEDLVLHAKPVPFGEGRGNDLDNDTALALASRLKGRLWP